MTVGGILIVVKILSEDGSGGAVRNTAGTVTDKLMRLLTIVVQISHLGSLERQATAAE